MQQGKQKRSLCRASQADSKSAPADNKGKKPNVVLIVTDDHGLDAAGCFGNRVIKTPNLDALATDGVIFTNAFCTSSSCSPSRAVILTGKYSHATGMYGLQHDIHHFACFDDVESLPVFLSKAGYRTARVGKYHVAPESVFKFEKVIKANGRNAVEMAERCESVITDKTKPFFLYFCTMDPHRSEPARCQSLPYKPNLFGNRPEGYPGVKKIEYDSKDVIVPSFMSDSDESRAELAQYYQSVSRIDQGLGRLFDALKKNGQYDNTLIIYISDNGVAFPGAKTTLYLPGMRLPCIVKPPGRKQAGGTCEALVNWADLAPTILDYAEAMPEKPDFHGQSFKTALQEENIQGWDVTYASHSYHEVTMYYPMRVVRSRKYKLIWNIAYQLEFPFASDLWDSATWQGVLSRHEKVYGKRSIEAFLHRGKFELYDMETDPDELENLAEKPAYQKVLDELKEKLIQFQKSTNDPWYIKWQHE